MLKIKEDMKKGEYKSVYLLYGEEAFLRDYYKKALTEKLLDPDLADFNYKEYTMDKPDTEDISMFLSSYPCMSEKKVLYIKDSDIFYKCNESMREDWKEIFSDIPDYAVIIFSETNIDKRSALYKYVTEHFCADEFPFQKEVDLINWIERYAKSKGAGISKEAAKYLIDCCGTSMYMLKNEIEKLSSYCQESKVIKEKDIDICSCKMVESKVFEMLDAFLEKDAKRGGDLYAALKLLKEEPIAINGAIFAKFNQLKKVLLFPKGTHASVIAREFGERDFLVKMWQKQADKTNLEKVNKILELSADTDHRIKSGLSDSWAALDVLIANLI